jgi:hypothetical protein
MTENRSSAPEPPAGPRETPPTRSGRRLWLVLGGTAAFLIPIVAVGLVLVLTSSR